MVKDSGIDYRVWIEPEVHQMRASLPGKVRQRVRRTINKLSTNPRINESKELSTEGLAIPAGIEVRRIRMEGWRIIYAIHEADKWVWVLAIHRRPPYNYEDLPVLISRIRD
jgi:mRNA-degrading endonuclease RelE of RelBE toxin-antitoxin system